MPLKVIGGRAFRQQMVSSCRILAPILIVHQEEKLHGASDKFHVKKRKYSMDQSAEHGSAPRIKEKSTSAEVTQNQSECL